MITRKNNDKIIIIKLKYILISYIFPCFSLKKKNRLFVLSLINHTFIICIECNFSVEYSDQCITKSMFLHSILIL